MMLAAAGAVLVLAWAVTVVTGQPRTTAATGAQTTSTTEPGRSAESAPMPPVREPSQPEPEADQQPRILIVGDSLTRQAQDPMTDLLRDQNAEILAKDGTTVGQWTLYLPALVEREQPDVLVIALGTNDNLAYDEPSGLDTAGRADAYGGRVEALLDATEDVPCRIWIEPSPFGFDDRYQENAPALNAALRATLADHGVRLASWGESMTRGGAFRNGWMWIDSIHLSGSGQIAYAALVAKAALDGCSEVS